MENSFLNYADKKLKLLEVKESRLMENKPLKIFKKAFEEWERELEEINTDKTRMYNMVGLEIDFLGNYQKKYNN